MRDVQAFAFMAALCLVLPAFLLRLRESKRLLWRLLFFAAMAVMQSAAAQRAANDVSRWFDWSSAVIWWLLVIGCWHRMEAARQREAIIARLRKDGAQ